MSLTLRRLTPDHVPQLVELEHATFPPHFHLGAAAFYYFLSLAEIKGKNYSVAIFAEDLLVGYGLMVSHPSDFFPGQEVAYMISMAVRRRYRREAVVPLINWMMREAFQTGASVEGKMRESTAFRMVLRNWQIIRRYGYRATHIAEIDPQGPDRMVNVRFEHIFMRDPLVWGGYQSITHAERTRRVLRALPRRSLRKVTRRLPETPLSPWLRRVTYLNQPSMPAPPESVTQQG